MGGKPTGESGQAPLPDCLQLSRWVVQDYLCPHSSVARSQVNNKVLFSKTGIWEMILNACRTAPIIANRYQIKKVPITRDSFATHNGKRPDKCHGRRHESEMETRFGSAGGRTTCSPMARPPPHAAR